MASENFAMDNKAFCGDDVLEVSVLKPKDPRSKAKYNIFSRLLLIWVDPLFWIGCHRNLEQNDIYAHPREADSEKLLGRFNRHWRTELDRRKRGKKPRLLIAILKCFWVKLLIQGLLLFVEVAVLVVQSVLLGYLANEFIDIGGVGASDNSSAADAEQTISSTAYYYSAGISLISFLNVLVHGHHFLLGHKNGMISRIAMTGAIYQKVLSLSQVTVGHLSIGHIVNLASNDVQRLEVAFIFIHIFWIAPLHLGVVTYLLYLEIGLVTFLLTGIVLVQVPLLIFLARMFSHLRLKSAKLTDMRIRVMNEVIAGIRVIKMYAWEYAFKREVTNLRRKESSIILQAGLVNAAFLGFVAVFVNVVMYVVFTVYTATGGELTPKKVFTTLSLVFTLHLTTVSFLTQGILGIVEASVATRRLQKLLELDECVNLEQSKCLSGTAEVNVRNISASWMNDKFKMVLRNVNFSANMDHHLVAVVGPIGSGKSTLLQCLLNELQPTEGNVDVKGTMSYAPQDPWVFSATLRENILFGKQYDRDLYDRVIKACALDKDIKLLLNGDLTFVGERGVTLSGGQKARVNLARAVYRDADIYLLDDPLSAVDTAVGKHIFEECLQGLLKDRLVILVTHQVHFAILASKVLVLKEGCVEAYGSRSELLSSGFDVQHMLGLVSGKEIEENERDIVLCKDGRLHNSLVRLRDLSTSLFDAASIYGSIYSLETFGDEYINDTTSDEIFQTSEMTSHGSLSTRVYFQFFRAGGSLALIMALLAMLLAEVGIVSSNWWLSNWATCEATDVNSSICYLRTNVRIYIYTGITIFAIVMNFVRAFGFYYVCVNASRVLHNRMFKAVLRAPMLFFETSPIGRVLNRFSKDVGFLDDRLPQVFCEFMILAFRCFAIIVTALLVNYWVLLPAAMFVVALLSLRWYYLKTARDIKRFEAIARSPIYSHLSTSLQGLAIIRSFRRQSVALKHFHDFQNQHSQGSYLYLVAGRWFSLRVDILSALFIATVCFISVGLTSYVTDVSLIGLGLTYVVSMSGLIQYVARISTDIENLMISGERVLAYSHLEPEANLKTLSSCNKPPETWPDKGELDMDNVVLRYAPHLPLVLKNISFSIKSSEKVGIVGRTGAGKSSIISVLYRLAEPGGYITIDGVDTKSIGLHDLRKKMSIIPQDPVLFSGTVRYNLDPFKEYSDLELWEVLKQVQLKGVVEQLDGQLSGDVSEGGSNFSVGQRQLVCLARALLRKNKILILDEATANVDLNTDRIIQVTIREVFSECTVLTIAHRLNTIMDSDRVLVMEDGQVIEFDSPLALLHKPESYFTKMVDNTGPEASRRLYQMAREATCT